MERFDLTERLDPEDELIGLLAYNGIRYRRENDGVRFLLSDRGCKWETVCKCAGRTVLIYGIYPFPAKNKEAALALINGINGRLVRGVLFLSGDTIVMRTDADLFDSYSAYEAIARALEYNAGAMVSFWQTLAPCSM